MGTFLHTMSSHLLLFVSIASTASPPVVEQQASGLGLRSGHEDTAVAAHSNALATKSQAEMVATVFAALNTASASNDAALAAAAKKGLRLVEGMNDINEIIATLGNAVALGEAITAKGNNSSAQAAILALLNHLADSNNANVANAAKAILIQEKKSQTEMVAAVFSALNEAAASNDVTLAAAANDGLGLVQGMNDINAIVTTLGNAMARSDLANPDAFAAIYPLWNRLAKSNNATAGNAANAILFSGTGLVSGLQWAVGGDCSWNCSLDRTEWRKRD